MNDAVKNRESALVLFSGGQDSTTCLFWAKQNFDDVLAVNIHYGQRHTVEVDAAKKIAELTGSKDTDDWAGCQVRIYATETEFGGETVECIRIKGAGAPQQARPKPAVAVANLDEEEIPF